MSIGIKVSLLLALLVSWVAVAGSLTTKETLSKAKEIAAQKLVGSQIINWGDHGALVEGVQLPTPLVHDWSEIIRHTLRQQGEAVPLINLTLELVAIDARGKKQKDHEDNKDVALAEVTELHSLNIGEVVALADPRGVAEMLIARTLDTNYEDDWRIVLVEMQVLATKTNRGVDSKATEAIEPSIQFVHKDELLFRD